MVRLLLYAYATGQPSSRKIEQAIYSDLAFRYLSANQHPDHDTIAHFRRRICGQCRWPYFPYFPLFPALFPRGLISTWCAWHRLGYQEQ